MFQYKCCIPAAQPLPEQSVWHGLGSFHHRENHTPPPHRAKLVKTPSRARLLAFDLCGCTYPGCTWSGSRRKCHPAHESHAQCTSKLSSCLSWVNLNVRGQFISIGSYRLMLPRWEPMGCALCIMCSTESVFKIILWKILKVSTESTPSLDIVQWDIHEKGAAWLSRVRRGNKIGSKTQLWLKEPVPRRLFIPALQ